jgi:hypothetical protein
MSLKEKIQVVLNQKGHFKCPNGSQKPAAKAPPTGAKPKAAKDRYSVVVANLRQRGAAKPKTVRTLTSTIRSLFQKDITDKDLSAILQKLEVEGLLVIEGTKVSYAW